MSDQLMLILMQITIFSSVTACVLIAVKQIFKWVIPPKVGMLMWVILLLRLLWPIYPESSVSVYNLIPAGKTITYTLNTEFSEEVEAIPGIINMSNQFTLTDMETGDVPESEGKHVYTADEKPVTLGEYLADTVYPENVRSQNADSARIFNLAILLVYAGGAAVFLAVFLLRYFRSRKRALTSAITCNDERILRLYRRAARNIGFREGRIPPLMYGSSSMLVGFVKPVVLFMERDGADDAEITMVLAHELNHARYRDNFILFFSSVVASAFWFNPLIWIVRAMLRRDIEVMCDSRTLVSSHMLRTEYAKLLFRSACAEPAAASAGCHFSLNSVNLRHRIKTISQNFENRMFPRICSAVLCLCIIAVCLTNPVVSRNIAYSDFINNYSELTGDSRETMHFANTVSVSSYLKQADVLIRESFGDEVSENTGGGRLEDLKRIARLNRYIPSAIVSELDSMKTDQVLTEGNCAVLNYCLTTIISTHSVPGNEYPSHDLVPVVIPADRMLELLSEATEQDARILRSCYNRGVKGASAEFTSCYTEAMYDLIVSRISGESLRDRFTSFYTRLKVEENDLGALSEELGVSREILSKQKYVYVLDPNISEREEKLLRSLIGAAYAGENEELYYLKKNLETYTSTVVSVALAHGGYSIDEMLNSYARYGIVKYGYVTYDDMAMLSRERLEELEVRISKRNFILSDYYTLNEQTGYYEVKDTEDTVINSVIEYLNRAIYPVFRDFSEDGILYDGIISSGMKNAIARMYDIGMMYGEDGVIYPYDTLTCGRSLYYAYLLVCTPVNLY